MTILTELQSWQKLISMAELVAITFLWRG